MKLHSRKQLRLATHDYSANGAYFITICTRERQHLLGQVLVGNGLDRSASMVASPLGTLVGQHLERLPNHFSHISLDKYCIMPNHIHAIICLDNTREMERSRPFPTLSTIIGLYKSGVSREYGYPIWQKSFNDRVIRNEAEYLEIWNYIDTNLQKWEEDRYCCR